ncbi:MAG: helix-turn-helix transcriptional regulator [Firmicutes bacterium]|nr:helix-turn-helix transcriptional regulator [Bacillota bacterium]
MELTFGTLLRIKRREAGLTQRELAEKAGLDFSYISKIENDRLPPPATDTVIRICHILNIPPQELLVLTGKLHPEIESTVSSSIAAQEFILEAKRLSLSEEDWRKLTSSLQKFRKE